MIDEEQHGRPSIRQFVEAINTEEMEPLDALYHDDVVIEWPQSGELISGRQNILGASPRLPDATRPPFAVSSVPVTHGPQK